MLCGEMGGWGGARPLWVERGVMCCGKDGRGVVFWSVAGMLWLDGTGRGEAWRLWCVWRGGA